MSPRRDVRPQRPGPQPGSSPAAGGGWQHALEEHFDLAIPHARLDSGEEAAFASSPTFLKQNAIGNYDKDSKGTFKNGESRLSKKSLAK